MATPVVESHGASVAGVAIGLTGLDHATLESKYRFVVGIDYGTMYTTVCYDEAPPTRQGREPIKSHPFKSKTQFIRRWPGRAKMDHRADKVPSLIAYGSENGSAENLWGYQVQSRMKSYGMTKVLLDENSGYNDLNLEADLFQLPPGKSAKNVAADFLREVYKWIIEQLSRDFGVHRLNIASIEFWFTVPGFWSESAKTSMEEVARMAGFTSRRGFSDKILVTSKLEASTASLLADPYNGFLGHEAREGDHILVCDCGDSNLEAGCYRIGKNDPDINFEELYQSSGASFGVGRMAVAMQLYIWMSKNFGENFKKSRHQKRALGSRFMSGFLQLLEDDVEKFSDDHIFELELYMPDVSASEHYDDDERIVKLRKSDLLYFFTSALANTLNHLDAQVKRDHENMASPGIQILVLVGSYASSSYLSRAVRKWCRTNDIAFYDPSSPHTMPAGGACLHGLIGISPSVKRSRRWYGISMIEPLRPDKDCKCCRFYDPSLRGWACDSRMFWQIEKGQVVRDSSKCKVRMEKLVAKGDNFNTVITLYSSDLDDAPELSCNDGINEVCKLSFDVDLSDAPYLESFDVEGEKVYRVRYNLYLFVSHIQGRLHFSAKYKGQVLATTSVSFS